MEEKRSFNKSLLVVSLLLLAVVFLLVALFVLRPTEDREGIVLPDPTAGPTQNDGDDGVPAEGFLQVTPDNVLQVLNTLERPAYYHQSYSVAVSSDKSTSVKTVELWVDRGWIHGEIRDGHMVRSVFSDGVDAWIWNEQELTPICVTLTETLRLEDLLGIPNFDYQQTLQSVGISEAGYAVREDHNMPYVSVSAETYEDAVTEYCFALQTGLLYSCVCTEDGTVVYEVTQTAFEQLADGDQAFQGRFCLPDGSVPFTAGTRMLPP